MVNIRDEQARIGQPVRWETRSQEREEKEEKGDSVKNVYQGLVDA